MTLRVILVGLGARSRIWRRVLEEDGAAQIVGMVDSDPARLVSATEGRHDIVTGATLAEVAAKAEADAVILITPPHGRAGQIADACAAGLAILAEKPLADSLAEAEAHVATADKSGVALMVGLNFRYLAVTRAMKALFVPAKLGAPAFGRFLYERWRDGYLPGINRYPLTMPQPMLWEQSIHHFDLMRHVYGADAVAISARTWNPPWSMYAGDANVAALITLANGVEITYHGTWAGNRNHLGFDWRSDCAHGIAVQADMFGSLSFALRDDKAMTPVALPESEVWVDDARGLWAAFRDHLTHGAPLDCSGADHLHSLRMVEAAIRSATTGMTINPAELTHLAEPVGRTSPPSLVMTEKRKHRCN